MPPLIKEDIRSSFYLHTCLDNLAHRSQSGGWEFHFLTNQVTCSLVAALARLKGKANGTTLLMSCRRPALHIPSLAP